MKETIKIRHKRKGYKKFLAEEERGYYPSKDKNKYPLGVDKIRIIDKGKNLYIEKVIDKKTGKIIRNIEELLTKHKKL